MVGVAADCYIDSIENMPFINAASNIYIRDQRPIPHRTEIETDMPISIDLTNHSPSTILNDYISIFRPPFQLESLYIPYFLHPRAVCDHGSFRSLYIYRPLFYYYMLCGYSDMSCFAVDLKTLFRFWPDLRRR
jgi:hypothetical protein